MPLALIRFEIALGEKKSCFGIFLRRRRRRPRSSRAKPYSLFDARDVRAFEVCNWSAFPPGRPNPTQLPGAAPI